MVVGAIKRRRSWALMHKDRRWHSAPRRSHELLQLPISARVLNELSLIQRHIYHFRILIIIWHISQVQLH